MRASAVRLLPPMAREVVSNRAEQTKHSEVIYSGAPPCPTAGAGPPGKGHRQEQKKPLRRPGGPVLALGGGRPHMKRGTAMNKNIDYVGMVNLLRHLQNAGLVSRKEARRIAARLRTETGADVIISP